MKRVRIPLRRWVTYAILTVVFAVTCFALSSWQFARRDETLRNIDLVVANYDAPPVPLAQLITQTNSVVPSHTEWRQVLVTGEYDSTQQLLVRNRPRESQPGFEVLTPLRTNAGDFFIVDRGWLPTGETQDSPDFIPNPPQGEVTVVVHLKPGEPTIAGRGAVTGQVATINLAEIAQVTGPRTYTNVYGLLVSEDPAVAMGDLLPAKKPDTSEGMHLSYALQWILFALMAFIALGWAIRREILFHRNPETVATSQHSSGAPSDEEVEDALFDAR